MSSFVLLFPLRALRRLVLRMQEIRKEKAKKEQEEAIEAEKRRRAQLKEMQEAKLTRQQQEMQEIAEERRKQKIADQRTKQRILDQIKADRDARKAEQQPVEPKVSTLVRLQVVANGAFDLQPQQQPYVPTPPKVDCNETRIQIRLPDGKPLVHTFQTSEPLASVRLYVQMNRTVGIFLVEVWKWMNSACRICPRTCAKGRRCCT